MGCVDLTSEVVMECALDVDLDWDESIVMDGYTADDVCTVVVDTSGGSCADWCED